MSTSPTAIQPAPVFRFRDAKERQALLKWREELRRAARPLVFTNGVFDLVHAGHISYLFEARSLGAALIIGLNSDSSVERLKGPRRPIVSELDRAALLAALKPTDAVAIFDEDTPFEIINALIPDVLVKGGDYSRDTIVGADVVEANGGRVLPLPFVEGRSTTGIVERILQRYGQPENERP